MTSVETHVQSRPDTVRWGRIPTQHATPVDFVDDGGIVVFDTVSHEGIMPDQGADPVAFFGSYGIPAHEVMADARVLSDADIPFDPVTDGPHIVTGPVAVRGARPGDVLRVEMLGLEFRAGYGVISNRHGRGVLSGEFPRPDEDGDQPAVISHLARVDPGSHSGFLTSSDGRTLHFPLAPFLGLIGVAPAVDEEPSSRPPGPFGGNIDIRHLTVGTALLLPVQAEGALLYVGDPHFAQGNGEVARTAFEAPLRARLRVSIEQGREASLLAARLATPWGETADHYIAIGLGETLDEAMEEAVKHAIHMVCHQTGIDDSTALAYLSAAADFEVSQAVNGIKGIHCMIRRDDLASVSEAVSAK
jgi:acetamidase/formamidase